MNFIDLCRKLVSFDTSPAHGSQECAEWIASYARECGFISELQTETLGGIPQANVILRSGPRADREFLLQTHLDTVDPGTFSLWTKTQSNPFNASIYGDTLYGVGSADTKLDFACKLEAAKEFLLEKQKLPFVLVGTFGAQTGMAGAVRLIRKKMVSAKFALIGEPTSLKLAREGQGLAVVEVTIPFSKEEQEYRKSHDLLESVSTQSKLFHGRSAHYSVPSLGENAIAKMFDYLVQLPQGIAIMDMDGGVSHNTVPASAFLEIDLVGGFGDSVVPKIKALLQTMREVESEFTRYPAEGFEQALASLNIGTIRTFDDNITVRGACRIPPSVPSQVYEGWMARLKVACEEQGATFSVKDLKTPFSTADSSTFLQGCRDLMSELGLPSHYEALSTATEANVLSRWGIECVVFGPGQSVGNSHEPNERVSINELLRATDFYRKVIKRFCL